MTAFLGFEGVFGVSAFKAFVTCFSVLLQPGGDATRANVFSPRFKQHHTVRNTSAALSEECCVCWVQCKVVWDALFYRGC